MLCEAPALSEQHGIGTKNIGLSESTGNSAPFLFFGKISETPTGINRALHYKKALNNIESSPASIAMLHQVKAIRLNRLIQFEKTNLKKFAYHSNKDSTYLRHFCKYVFNSDQAFFQVLNRTALSRTIKLNKHDMTPIFHFSFKFFLDA